MGLAGVLFQIDRGAVEIVFFGEYGISQVLRR